MRKGILATAICVSILGLSHAGDAPAAIRKPTHIPAQGLDAALRAVAHEHELYVIFASQDVEDIRTAGAVGKLTPDETFRQLLNGTGLAHRFVDDKTVTIIPANAGKQQRSAQAGSNDGVSMTDAMEAQKSASFWDRFRLAQADAGSPASRTVAAQGGEALPASAQIEEVIVTAQKREERLQDVPISISVLDGVTLDKSTVQSVSDVLSSVPGVASYGTTQAGGTVVTVRGVAPAAEFFGGSNTVSYYLDSVPFGFVNSAIAPDANAYDMERIEVLRGPQGTLYGASALNGVVRVLTHDADLNEFEFKARTSGSSTRSGDDNYRGDLAVNVPIIEGRLGARAVAGYQRLGGWIDKAGEDDANDGRLRNLRLKLNAQPTENLSIDLSTWLARRDFGAPTTSNSRGQSNSLVDEPLTVDYDVHGLKIGYDFPGVSVTSMSSYLDYEVRDTIDFINVLQFSYPLVERFDADVFSEEVNFTSTHEGPWRWTAGAFYRRAENRTFQTLPAIITLEWTEGSTAYAIFGELTRRFLGDELELTVGARYFHDEVTSDTELVPDFHEKATFEATTPRAVLTWLPDERLTIYGSYSEGFRSGSPQAYYVTGGVPGFPPVKPDKLHNYEVGSKANLLNGRFSVEAAVYFIDWQDVQQYITVPFGSTRVAAVVNGDSASGLGFDLGLTARPIERLELGISYSRNDLTVDSDVISADEVLFSKGDRLSMSPKYTVAASAAYVFPIGGLGLEGRLSGSFAHTAPQSSRAIVVTDLRIGEGDPMSSGRVSFSVRSADHWEMTLFGDNITNERGDVYHNATDLAPDSYSGIHVRPRTVGLQVEYRL